MSDKSRERSYVDAFSDYGLDERQTAIQHKIMTKCFKILFYGVGVLTIIWLSLPILAETQIHTAYVAASYFVLAVICSAVYAVQASKQGAINGITAFAWSGKGNIIVSLFVVFPFLMRILTGDFKFDENNITIIVIAVLAVVYNIIMHRCGKRNFEVLDGKSEDDTDESEEE